MDAGSAHSSVMMHTMSVPQSLQEIACLQVCLWRLVRLHAEVREDEEWRAPSGKDITGLQSRRFWHQKLFMQSIKLEAPVRPGSIKSGMCGPARMPARALSPVWQPCARMCEVLA